MSTQTIPISGTKPALGSTMTSERLQSADAPVPERFDFDTSAGVRLRVQSPDPDQLQHVPTAMNRDSQDTPEVRV
jgi:hypothetical protein